MKSKRRWICTLGAFFLGVSGMIAMLRPEPVKAEVFWPTPPTINEGASATVIEVNTGTVLYTKDELDHRYPASITKVMTTMLAIENCSLDETVIFSYDAVYGGNEGDTSHIARNMNEELTMEQCLYAVMLESANECAYATAEHVAAKSGGVYSDFINLMNTRAKELGCENTHFNNCNGLPDRDHWTCAYDMALIAAEAYRNETFRTIAGSRSYKIPITNKCPEPYYCHNHHKMIYPWDADDRFLYEYSKGGKTGYTDAARHTLVSFAEKDGLTLACVVMTERAPGQYQDTKKLFDYCFDNFQAVNIADNEVSLADNGLANAGVLNNNGAYVTLDSSAYVVLPKNVEFTDASHTLITDIDNETIARLDYTYNGKKIGSAKIVTSGVVAEGNPFENQPKVEDNVKIVLIKPWYIAVGILGVVVLGTIIYFAKKLYDNFYVIKHNFEIRRMQRMRFKSSRTKRKSSRRRRNRLFK